MTVRQLIPQGLAEMAPGPDLAAPLAGIDIRALTGADAVEVLRARARQLSHEQARVVGRDGYAADEIRAADPEWAARCYATAVRERNVIGYLNEDGTATVTGSALPVEEAAFACAHVEDLARAAKRAGHPGRTAAGEYLPWLAEVANMVVYTVSPGVSATTGAALRVDGGVVDTIT